MKEQYFVFRKPFRLLKLFATCLFLPIYAAHSGITPQINENFDDNSTDQSLWSIIVIGTGPTVQEVNGRLEISIPGTSQQGSAFNYTGMAGYYLAKNIYAGDFDARVDFRLLNWPRANGVRVALSVGAWQDVERDSVIFQGDGRDAYVMNLWPGLASQDTTDQSGKLRFVRTGNLFTGFYWDSALGNWHNLGSSIYPSGDKGFGLSVFTAEGLFSHSDVKVAFDNFIVTPTNENSPVPEPSTYIAGLSALGMLVLSRRNRK